MITFRHLFITLACLVVAAPVCLFYYFTECEEVGCGGRPVLANMNIVLWTLILLVNYLFRKR